MDTAAIIILALGSFGFAATAVALGVRSGSLRATIGSLSNKLNASEKERAETREEFEQYQTRTKAQLESLRDKVTDYQDLLATCTDPAVLHDHFDGVLQEITRSLGGSSSD